MGKKQGKIVQFEFRAPRRADDDVRTSEERGADSRSETLRRMRRKGGQSGHHWTFKGWTAPSPFLAEMMRSPITAPPALRGAPMLESGALAYRRLKNGELMILLVSKKRSKKWGIPKGKVSASLSFGETAAKEAFEEAGVIGRVSPNSIGMFRAKKGTPIPKNIEVWVYLLEVDEMLSNWPEKKNVRLGGYHAKWPPESSVSLYSLIYVTTWRRARIAVEAWCEKRDLRPAAIQHEARAGELANSSPL
jgi:8-oxo-dGTP pyrophosphatase MutT (NUDIX family)